MNHYCAQNYASIMWTTLLIAQLIEQVGDGFEYRSSLNQSFQAVISQLLKLCTELR